MSGWSDMLFLLLFFLSALSVQAAALPAPYEHAKMFPFVDHGWYSHASFFEDYMKKNRVKTIIEVGSWLGSSTRHLAKCLPHQGVIYAVDTWLGSEEHQPGQPYWSFELDHLYELFLSNVIHEGLASKIIPVRLDSATAAKVLPVQADIVYIDGAHDTDSVYRDLKMWFPHVKPGGILCGNAWGYYYLDEAVKRFAREENIAIEESSVYILRKKDPLAHALPIQFSIPEEKVISHLPDKDIDFVNFPEGDAESYQRALYAVTKKTSGWDSLRHYEILANGCIPYFIDLESCENRTLALFPKELIVEAMHLPGVSHLKIDHSVFDREKYNEILHQLLAYTREHLTSRKMAEYLLDKSGYSGKGPVLFLASHPPDEMQCLIFRGLRQTLGSQAIDVPPLEASETDRSHIEERIRGREFERIIYGSVHRGRPFHDLVVQCYPPERIVYLCGEDCHHCEQANSIPQGSFFFLKELK
jgi:predicted O-methyltransferase YrrM